MGVSGGAPALGMLSQGVTAGFGAYSQSQAERAQGDYQAKMALINQRNAEFQAKDATRRGDKAASQYAGKVKQVQGSQRASLAAQGIDINSGSAAASLDETAAQGAIDVQTIKSNAWREAWGFKTQAQNIQQQSAISKMGSDATARNTLLTGGLNFLKYGTEASAYYAGQKISRKDKNAIDADDNSWLNRR